MTTLLQKIRDWFSFDTRSLAVARMALGVAILADMLWRLGSAEWHYSDLGVLPRDIFLGQFSYPWSFSFHHANGSTGFAIFMLTFHAFCAVAMAIGWRTRLSTFFVCILTISLHNRNWYLNNGGDDALRSFMWLAMFIPWGEMWSVDQWRRGEGEKAPRLVSGSWVACWFLLTFCIYFVSYILKTSPIWRSDYTALYFASRLDIFATTLGRALRPFMGVHKFLTFGTIMLEWMGPLMLLAGWLIPRRWNWQLRTLTVITFWGLHLGIILTMNIGLFPYYCLGFWAAFLPRELWDKILGHWPGVEAKIRRFYAWLSGAPTRVQGPEASPVWLRYASQGLGVFMFLNIFFWNLSTLKPPLKVSIPFWVNVGRWTHTYQEWNMFAPFPKQENLWLELPAELEDGSTIELISGSQDVLSSKQDSFPGNVRDEHWRKFYMNLADNDKIARHYAGAWCRLWNRPLSSGGREPKLRRFSINVFHYVNQNDFTQSPLFKKTVWNHWCFENDYKAQDGGPAPQRPL